MGRKSHSYDVNARIQGQYVRLVQQTRNALEAAVATLSGAPAPVRLHAFVVWLASQYLRRLLMF